MSTSPSLAKYSFFVSLTLITVGGAYLYGLLSQRYDMFPAPLVSDVLREVRQLMAPDDAMLSSKARHATALESPLPELLAPGLVMIAGALDGGRDTFVRVIERDGTVVHEWVPRWQEVWGSREGEFPAGRRPRGNNGMHLHGIDVLPDGSFVANFENLSTFRMDVCGQVRWKLPNLGHHSVFFSENGYLWVSAERFVAEGDTGLKNHRAPLRSWTVQKISLEGDVLQEIEIIDLLLQNDLLGLLYLSNTENGNTAVEGDTLHLNDVDEVPATYDGEVFAPGDLMISLRNINALVVFDPRTLAVKFVSIGRLLRQHDSDFLPTDRISVFDNRNLRPSRGALSSRIVEIDGKTGSVDVVLAGDGDQRFFTAVMGSHTPLANGNRLVNASGEGRVLEFTPDGRIAWRYSNRITENRNGRVYNARVLPAELDASFFAQQRASCAN